MIEFLQANGLAPDTRLTSSFGFVPGLPLHAEHGVDEWWGCLEPERPYDDEERWDLGCPKCQMRMRLVLAVEGGDIVVANGCFSNWPGVIAACCLSVRVRAGTPPQRWRDASPGSITLSEVLAQFDELGGYPNPSHWSPERIAERRAAQYPTEKAMYLKRIAEYPDLRESLLGQLRTLDASGGGDCGWNPPRATS